MYHQIHTHLCIRHGVQTSIYIYETYFLLYWLPRWNQILTQLRFIHNWVTRSIQWMVRWWVRVHHCGLFSPFFFSSSSSDREVNRIVIYGFPLLPPPQSFCSFLIRNLSLFPSLWCLWQAHLCSTSLEGFYCKVFILLFCSMLFVNLLLFLLHNQVFTLPSSFQTQTQTRPVLHTLATAPKKSL